jgi:ACT domain-containing protein
MSENLNKKQSAVITVVGHDRVGIIAAVSKLLAEQGVNINDISQTILQDVLQ